ncbi:L-seryl-tRNA(Sec) selenium transferase [Rhodovulum sp. PH10]|uniref:L-seryl-tRNA(Sec) selenium transferase n=1 Tax=Rhodovulum sp. PH10 TaxID=1187851 RepID=UPI00027C1EC5|nr:L-seryl-tRNA(Sec) selenium transferase [Rhodovulum sp. PH10]EJW09763.1 L-seryl-tRNA(Sec) selenium transferase [Rhodovulum sp. PH10]
MPGTTLLRRLPSVDEVLKTPTATLSVAQHGRTATVGAVRTVLDAARAALRAGDGRDALPGDVALDDIAACALAKLEKAAIPAVRPVLNLTGVVLHTNLGRAALAEAAIEAATTAMRQAIALEFDLATGKRGERDTLVRDLLCELTGAEDATLVNNNAAAMLLVLNTFAKGREAVVSRGELIEIGGAFRMPDIMARAGAKLREVGTTNRTHPHDFEAAIGPRTGLVLRVHTSNYRIEGFTSTVPPLALAALAHAQNVPVVNDLGSGTLIGLERFGLAHEPTVAEAVADGADLVTFSGDKLLGGPQAGFIVGRKALIEKINRNPMKRALRVDKIRLAAVEATLKLYRHPERLAERLPTLRLLARRQPEIAAQAERLCPALAAALGERCDVRAIACESRIGSGALPLTGVPSAGLAVRPKGRVSGRMLDALAATFRALPVPVIGRIEDQAFVLDLRGLEDEATFVESIAALAGRPA